ncbi:10063_t:CDS:1, partial [Rhizophagus irregularis]
TSPEIMGVFTNKTAKQTLFVRERYLVTRDDQINPGIWRQDLRLESN